MHELAEYAAAKKLRQGAGTIDIVIVEGAPLASDRTGPGTQARAPWRATVLTLFPELFPGPLAASLAGEALKQASGRSRRSASASSGSGATARSTTRRPAAAPA